MSNKELAERLHKPINIKFEKRKVNSPFMDNIWGAADMQLKVNLIKEFVFLLYFIDFSVNRLGLFL